MTVTSNDFITAVCTKKTFFWHLDVPLTTKLRTDTRRNRIEPNHYDQAVSIM